MVKQLPAANEQQLILKILSFGDDPEAFVLYTFPWGVEGGPLEKHRGPREWQTRALRKMKAHIAKNRNALRSGIDPELLKLARASGRGIGKSAFLAWVAIWLFSCHPGSTSIVSANTEQQLKSTTFPEIRKWATMSINSRWFEHNAMSLRPADWLVESMKKTTKLDDAYWYIQARLWSEEAPDAYAGVHSQIAMCVLFDEASGIASCIWPVTHGYFTDKTIHRFWISISNPRNPSGEFFECFHNNRDQWDHETIDAREVTENDRTLYDDIIRQYGVDSDQARVEVYGQFPQQGDENFFNRAEVLDAVNRELIEDIGAPLLMGVDPARMGRDKAVIRFMQGRDARSIAPIVYPKCTTREMADYCASAIEKHKPDAVFIEGDGIGGPVAELLREYKYRVVEVQVGSTAQDKDTYFLHRTEIWGRMRDWVSTGCLPDEKELISDLCSMRYGYTIKGQTALWPKEKMKKLGFASPDYADALAMMFSRPISRNDTKTSRKRRVRVATGMDFDVFT